MPVAPKNRSYLEDFQIIHPGVNWFLHAILRWKDYLLARYCYRGIAPNTMQCTAVACHAHSTPRVSRSASANVVNDVGLCIAVYDTLMAWWYNRCPLYLISGWQTFSLGDGQARIQDFLTGGLTAGGSLPFPSPSPLPPCSSPSLPPPSLPSLRSRPP